jgi:2,4-dienoyl-CoA reductase-like NADH-dependent reductase (Old Yellow Enzyme family)
MQKKSHEAGCISDAEHNSVNPEFDLLSPLKIRGVTLRNRIVVSPMCQYSSTDGFADDWHLVHLGSRAVGGAGLIFTEATAVTAQGRISPSDLGIYNDKHIENLSRIANFIHRMGGVAGIQLAHAGRKGSCRAPWEGGAALASSEGGWELVAPSPVPFSDQNPTPKELDKKGIQEIKTAFKVATQRALKAGFKVIEIHAAHGYLLHSFLSQLSNQRKDEYGGGFENRIRLLCEIASELRSIIPDTMPLFTRISATDWVDNGWDLQQSIELAKALKKLGVDLIDTSSGALVPYAKIPVGPNYQVPFSSAIRTEAEILTGAVGLITEPQQASDIITSGKADLIFLAREHLREPYWALKASHALGQDAQWPTPYGFAVKRHKT